MSPEWIWFVIQAQSLETINHHLRKVCEDYELSYVNVRDAYKLSPKRVRQEYRLSSTEGPQ